MKYYFSILLFVFILVWGVQAQDKKSVEANYIGAPLTIDGILNEDVYTKAKPARDFVQLQPYNGKPAPQPTEAYFFYDQTAIYVGARLYDSSPDSIYNFLTQRDDTGMSDYFGVYLDPYNQGQLAFGFFITPAGIQIDIKAVKSDGDSEDGNWNAVWESKTCLTKDGWTVEMKIPFSALRFSEKTGSTWGLNMFRNIRRYNNNNSWNLIDRKISGFIHQEGQLTGLKNIKTPIRLSLSPYTSSYYEPKSNNGTSHFLYKGGLDLKYGINDAFTLDMMVIPDFGQIRSDDKKLNLSPYELYYDEKRQFFTEGTELFQRGNIFYSRRIGASPKFSDDKETAKNEIVDYNPSETQLVNATKISGRTDKGWGLGVLNAMSLPANAIVKDTVTGKSHNVIVQPFTNYNIAVIDKSLPNNSYISIINSNVSMANNPFHANVTATEFQLRNKTLTYALKGKGGFSTRGDSVAENGYYGSLGIEKTKGKLFFGLSETVYSDKYNPNDLGYLQRNNQVQTNAWLYYQIIEPFLIFREANGDIWYNYSRMYNPNTLYDHETGFDLFLRFKNNYALSSRGQFTSNKFDYFEPRTTGRFYKSPYCYNFYVYLSTDQRKSLNFNFQYEVTKQPVTGQLSNTWNTSASWRIGNRTQIDYGIGINITKNERGFSDKPNSDSIIFAKRNVSTTINTLSASYILSNKASLSLRARHYWSGVKNTNFYLLQTDGSLTSCNDFSKNLNQNYNAFTVDMILRWIFAPGSELSLAWKTLSNSNEDDVEQNYWKNFQKSWLNQSNSISLKVLYYIDYNNLVKKKKR